MWENVIINIRPKVWLNHCEEMIELEKKAGITMRDKKCKRDKEYESDDEGVKSIDDKNDNKNIKKNEKNKRKLKQI